jgi:hypothetical protein
MKIIFTALHLQTLLLSILILTNISFLIKFDDRNTIVKQFVKQ